MSSNTDLAIPIEEALQGHPLYGFGLKHHGIFAVDGSPLLDEIKQNSCHPRATPEHLAKFHQDSDVP